jgi:hypothetical protein
MAMTHRVQDAVDAYARRPPTADWHPVLAAVEDEPGTWRMVDPMGRCYGVVRLITLGDERGYRAVTWAERSADRRLIGYYRTLRAATAAAHGHFVRSHGVQGPARANH